MKVKVEIARFDGGNVKGAFLLSTRANRAVSKSLYAQMLLSDWLAQTKMLDDRKYKRSGDVAIFLRLARSGTTCTLQSL